MNGRARAYPAVVLGLLLAGAMLSPGAGADPTIRDEGGGFRTATWTFATPADYVGTNVTMAPGNATLAKTVGSHVYPDGPSFSTNQSAPVDPRVVVNAGVRLAGSVSNLIADGGFDQSPGPWGYTNGTTGKVVAQRDVSSRGRMSHESARLQFDSMDDVFGPNSWNVSAGGAGSSSALNQDTGIKVEGTGSLRDNLTIGVLAGSYAGASRDDMGTWNWSAYNRLALWIEGSLASGIFGHVHLQNVAGANPWDSPNQSISAGWNRYVFDFSSFPGDPSSIDRVDLRFSGPGGTYAVYVDDLVVFNRTAFTEFARIEQTFTKPMTSGNPGSVVLKFDVQAAPSVNVTSWMFVEVGTSVEWSETPVVAGARSLYLDLSANLALRAAGSFPVRFSLELTRAGAGESNMSVWIDNVNITATDYQSGSFTAVRVDPGSSAIWTTATASNTTPPGTSVVVETRTGNSTLEGDSTWSPWQPTTGIVVQSPPNRYLQWRLLLITANGSQTPVVTRLELVHEKYLPAGTVRTMSFLPPEPLVAWRQFLANDTEPPGTSLAYEISSDNGTSWAPVGRGQDLSARPRSGIVVRANLVTVNTSTSPTIASFALRYEYFGPLGAILVQPTNVTLTADDTVTFTSTALDVFGHVLTTFGCNWRTNDPLGNVSGGGTLLGVYTPGQAGLWWVRCFNADQTVWGSANVTVTPGVLARIIVRPPVASVPVGQSLDFTAEGQDADGNTVALSTTSWSTTIGQISVATPAGATLIAPSTNGTGTITATHGGVSGNVSGSATVTVTTEGTPKINGVVVVPNMIEDDPSSTLNLTRFAMNQPDPKDTLDNLKWTLTDVDPRLYTVFGQGTFNRHDLVFTPRKDASGVDAVTLWLEDQSGARDRQDLNITILSVNDPPAFVAVPTIYVRHGERYAFDFAPYVRDIDTPERELSITTEAPVELILPIGLNVVYNYTAQYAGRTLWVRHQVDDGQLSAEVVVTIIVTDNLPPRVVKPLPDLRFPEDTVLRDAFLESLRSYFGDDAGEHLFFSSNFTNLFVWINDTGGKVQVDVAAKPDFSGADRITFRATDPKRAFAEYTVRVVVDPVNDPPVLAWGEDVYVRFNVRYSLDLTPYVSDIDDPMERLTLTTDDRTRALVDRFAISFLYLETGTPRLALTLSDGALSVTKGITVHVGGNRPPELVLPFDDVELLEDTSRRGPNLALHFQDLEDSSLTFSVTGRNIAVEFAGTNVTLTPARNWFGQEVLVFRANDTGRAFAIGVMFVDVLPVNDAPVWKVIPPQVVEGGRPSVLDLRDFVDDVDNDTSSDLAFSTGAPNVKVIGFLLLLDFPAEDRTVQVRVDATDGISRASIAFDVFVRTPGFWSAIFWPWSGVGLLGLAAVAYVAWTRALARRFLFEDLFLIGREGRLIMHTTRRMRPDRDEDIFSGMLTAITMFVRDSFKEENEELKRFEFGDRKVAVEKGKYVFGAAIFAGARRRLRKKAAEVPPGVFLSLKHFLADVQERYAGKLTRWSGDVDDLPGLKAMMDVFGARGRYRRGDWKRLTNGDREGRLSVLRRLLPR